LKYYNSVIIGKKLNLFIKIVPISDI